MQVQNLWNDAQSAASNSTPASSAVTSIPRAASNACRGFRKELRGKMSAMNAGSIRSVCEWRSRLLPEWHLALTPRDGPSTICLKIRGNAASQRREFRGAANWIPILHSHFYLLHLLYAFCVGLNKISLANDCDACVTSMATTCATSSGLSILLESFPMCGLSSVSTEPGQTTETLMLWPRSSSATE